jgi:dihydropyrimidinase
MSTLIKNGTLVTSSETLKADLRIENGKVDEIGARLTARNDEKVVDASGLMVLPGGVDAHVHLDLPMMGTISSDDHYTGTKAAAFGGTTTVIDFISQDSDILPELVAQMRQKVDAKAAVDYSFHMNITHYNQEVDRLIPGLVKEGITSIKVFTAYNNRLRLQDGEIFRVMRTARDCGILTMMHAENGDVIDILVKEAIEANHLSPVWHARTRPRGELRDGCPRSRSCGHCQCPALYRPYECGW